MTKNDCDCGRFELDTQGCALCIPCRREYLERQRALNRAAARREAAKHYCTSVAARLGLTTRVIIVDQGDLIVYEWKHGEGIVFPPRDDVKA